MGEPFKLWGFPVPALSSRHGQINGRAIQTLGFSRPSSLVASRANQWESHSNSGVFPSQLSRRVTGKSMGQPFKFWGFPVPALSSRHGQINGTAIQTLGFSRPSSLVASRANQWDSHSNSGVFPSQLSRRVTGKSMGEPFKFWGFPVPTLSSLHKQINGRPIQTLGFSRLINTPRLVYQRPSDVLFCLWEGIYKTLIFFRSLF